MEIEISQADLSGKEEFVYLSVFVYKYHGIWESDPDNLEVNLTEEQISLMMFGILYDQVQNGGFIQLIFNRYAFIIDEGSPIYTALEQWEATDTIDILKEAAKEYKLVKGEFEIEKTLENLSELYTKLPQFEALDQKFYEKDETNKIKKYVEEHISKFASITQ